MFNIQQVVSLIAQVRLFVPLQRTRGKSTMAALPVQCRIRSLKCHLPEKSIWNPRFQSPPPASQPARFVR